MKRLSFCAMVVLGSSSMVACGSDDETIGQIAATGGFPQGSGGFVGYATGGAPFATGGIVGQGGIIAAGGFVATGGAVVTGGSVGSGGSSSGGAGGAGTGGSGGAAAGAGGASAGGAGGSTGGSGAGAGGTSGAGGGIGGVAGDASVSDSGGDGAPPGPDAGDAGVDGAVDASVPGCRATFVPLTLSGGPATLTGTVQGDTADGVSRIDATACGAANAGDGPDLAYSFMLDRERDVTITLSSSFDGILRTYLAPCGAPLNEAGADACSNAGTGSEQMSFPRLGAGTYYVALDGKGAGDKGTFTLTVKATCTGIDQLRLVELGIGTTDYVVIRNMSDCPAELGGVKILFDDSVATDLTTTLPTMTLAPGGQLRIQENLGASVPGAVDAGGGIPFQFDRGGTVRLCKSNCGNATDILDVLSFADGDATTADPPPPPPAPVKFLNPVSGITTSNQNSKSWVRVGTGAQKPNFAGGDWCTGDPGAVFGLRLDEFFVGEPDYVAIKNRSDCVINLSPFRTTFVSAGSSPVNAIMDARSVVVAGRVFVSETPAQALDIVTTALAFQGGGAGTVQLCRGACSIPGNTIDVIALDGTIADGGTVSYPALSGGLVFLPDGLTAVTSANQSTTSYVRSALAGGGLRFLASDWTTGAKTH